MKDADKMPTEGEIVVNAVIMASAIQEIIEDEDDECYIVWAANAPEQIEAALAEQGYRLTKI
jgi:transcriptional/translational regulatory protein YebC/TACO1